MTDQYVSTPNLPDDQGKSLLDDLGRLHSAIYSDPETSKKIRSGSYAERHAIAALQAALVKASAHFERHREMGHWLSANHYEHIEAYDPILGRTKLTDEIRDLQWRMKRLDESSKNWIGIVSELIKRLPPGTADVEQRVLETMITKTQHAGAS